MPALGAVALPYLSQHVPGAAGLKADATHSASAQQAAQQSAMLLPGDDERANRLLAEHLTAEQPKTIIYDGAGGIAWQAIPGRDNDWWDCLVGNCMAASMLGCALNGEKQAAKVVRTFALPGARR